MTLQAKDIKAIKGTIESIAKHCGAELQAKPFDQEFYQECVDDALRRGYPMDGYISVRTYLRMAASYGSICLAHLQEDKAARIWVTLFTSSNMFIDDTVGQATKLDDLYQFNDRFIQGQPQGNSLLDALADIIRRAPECFQRLAANYIITCALNIISVSVLEYETKAMTISSEADQFVAYSRMMSGAGEAFAYYVFPRGLPLNDYIQAIPDIAALINYMNDVLSFYKEEKAGETVNFISLHAICNNVSKFEVLDELANDVAKRHTRILKIMETSPAACEAYKRYVAGYITFHVSSERYQLLEVVTLE